MFEDPSARGSVCWLDGAGPGVGWQLAMSGWKNMEDDRVRNAWVRYKLDG